MPLSRCFMRYARIIGSLTGDALSRRQGQRNNRAESASKTAAGQALAESASKISKICVPSSVAGPVSDRTGRLSLSRIPPYPLKPVKEP